MPLNIETINAMSDLFHDEAQKLPISTGTRDFLEKDLTLKLRVSRKLAEAGHFSETQYHAVCTHVIEEALLLAEIPENASPNAFSLFTTDRDRLGFLEVVVEASLGESNGQH